MKWNTLVNKDDDLYYLNTNNIFKKCIKYRLNTTMVQKHSMSCSLQKLFPKHFHLAGKYKKHPPAGTLWEQSQQSYLSSWQNIRWTLGYIRHIKVQTCVFVHTYTCVCVCVCMCMCTICSWACQLGDIWDGCSWDHLAGRYDQPAAGWERSSWLSSWQIGNSF